jgi:hypothetical protein
MAKLDKFRIKQLDAKSWDGEVVKNAYSVYENPNEELKEKIRNFTIDKTRVEVGFPPQEWEIVEYEGEEVKCKQGKNIHYFKKNEIEEALKDKFDYELNKTFLAYKHFRETYGIISQVNKYKDELYSFTVLDLQGPINLFRDNAEFNTLSVEHYGPFCQFDIKRYEGFIVEESNGYYKSMNLYFDSEGNFVNRNYNEDLDTYESGDAPFRVVFDALVDAVSKFRELKYFRGHYYVDGKKIKPFFKEIERKEIYYKRNYGFYESKSKTIPKKAENRTCEDLLNDIVSLLPEDLLSKFDLEPIKKRMEV